MVLTLLIENKQPKRTKTDTNNVFLIIMLSLAVINPVGIPNK